MNFFKSNNRTYSIIMLTFALVVMVLTLNQLIESRTSSASIIKKYSDTKTDGSVNSITYNGEEMYTANATFYDYYSDTQVNESATPAPITDALDNSKNTFSKFNTRIMSILKYNDSSSCPAKYPLYQGRPGDRSDMKHIYDPNSEDKTAATNYWVAAHSGQGTVAATMGLVDDKLKYDSYGNSVITQTNPSNNKTSILPYFDKKLLTTNTFDNSKLTLGKVIENVSFPFRRVEKNGITYYEFYSSKDTIRMNSNNQLDYYGVNNKEQQVLDAEGNPGFFPYNTKDQGKSSSLNFGHGVKIEIPFNITKDGRLKNNDMIFEFSGDDDVWIYIDDELALDLGGNHGEVSGTINFAKATSIVKKAKNPKIAFASRLTTSIASIDNSVINDYETKFSQTLQTKLKDTTKTHTLTMFYMERGLNVSNMKLSFNLPEPTKLIVDNKIDTSNVNSTFNAKTLEMANKDEFIMDVADKTNMRGAQIGLLPNENVAFINEFNANDILIIQESALKDTSRKLTNLYSTSWELKEKANDIAKGSTLLITDKRTSDDDTLKFSNKDNDDTPLLRATYTNSPKTGEYMIVCKVTDSFISKYKDYSQKNFTFNVTHSNIFGSKSSTTPYNGSYIVYDINNKSTTKTTTDGTVQLKPGEKAVIKSIPVLTNLTTTVSLDSDAKVSSIKATEHIKIDTKKLQASGSITTDANTVQYTITNEEEKIQQIKNETIPLSNADNNDKIDTSKNKLVQIDISEDGFDSSPKTNDTTNYPLLITLIIASLIIMLYSSYTLIRSYKR